MIRVITGPMFSGKSGRLIEICMAYIAIDKGKCLQCFKPSKDKRDSTYIKSRKTNIRIEVDVIERFEDIVGKLDKRTKVIVIDEAQFIEGDYMLLEDLSRAGYMIYIGGLRVTSELKAFGKMAEIMTLADEIEILRATCEKCGEEAEYTICRTRKTGDTLIGDKEIYYPICRKCLNKEEKNEKI